MYDFTDDIQNSLCSDRVEKILYVLSVLQYCSAHIRAAEKEKLKLSPKISKLYVLSFHDMHLRKASIADAKSLLFNMTSTTTAAEVQITDSMCD